MASRLEMNGADRGMETRDQNESGSSSEKTIGPKSYSYSELARVTGHFSLNNLIGRGGFGHVFKASLDGEIRAIKRLDFPDVQSEGGLENEIMIVQSLSHKNLVELVGYCIDGANRLLILKYFPNGSLRSKLHGSDNVLDWKTRMKIAIGSARGLEYLHENCTKKVIHLDIKPDNILLDEDFEPKITDFGLAKFFTNGATHISISSVMGTHVYEDPETTKQGKYSDKSDIYSFGVTLLELITGREPIDSGIDIVTWANPLIKKALKRRYTNFIDSNLQSFDREQMYRMVSCVNSCLNQPPNSRPTMKKICLVLEGDALPEVLYDPSIIHRGIGPKSYSYSELAKATDNFSLQRQFDQDDFGQAITASLDVFLDDESSSLHDKYYKGIGPKSYSYSELAKATDNFSLQRQFDQDDFGQAFTAALDGKICVVKKFNKISDVQLKGDFEMGITHFNIISHKNLLKLVGYCIDGANRLLISEFFPNMSLRYQLHEKKNVLDWRKRMNIAIGSARGLECLHEYCQPKIIHLNFKSNNIFLDDDFQPKVSDFGIALFFKDPATNVFRSSTFGTHIYADPLSMQLEKYSDKSDVYSFGVILLELITGRNPMIDGNVDIVTWAQPLIKKALEGEYMDFVDSRLKFFDRRDMYRMIFCANICINQPLKSRPSMKKIREALEGMISLDSLSRDE